MEGGFLDFFYFSKIKKGLLTKELRKSDILEKVINFTKKQHFWQSLESAWEKFSGVPSYI